MLKYSLILTLLASVLMSEDVEYKGNIGVEASYYSHDIPNKRSRVSALHMEAEWKKTFENAQFVVKVKGVLDSDDKGRRYVDFNDLYYKYKFEDSDLQLGRNTRFWGALEFYNHTDVFNTKDWLDDPFDFDSKIGAWNLAYTKYFGDDELSVIIRVHEEKQPIQDPKSVYNYFPLPYDDDLLTQESRNRPSFFLKYSGTSEDIQLDYSFIYENGYDEQRYMSVVEGNLRQNAYLVNKLLGFATLVSGSTIYKTELSYTFSSDEKVSDYAQIGVGIEHTLYGFWGQKDLGLLTEYYRYESRDDTKLGAEDFGNLFANDLTLGFRLSVNDFASSELLGGLAIDLDNKEKIFFVKYDTRLYEIFKLKFVYQHLAPESDSIFEELDRVSIEFGYYF